jgi:hypothetical protein
MDVGDQVVGVKKPPDHQFSLCQGGAKQIVDVLHQKGLPTSFDGRL